jgi:hypothetical protein
LLSDDAAPSATVHIPEVVVEVAATLSYSSPTLAISLRGRAVQVDPIKPTFKPPGAQRLELQYDEPLSDLAFKFSLRR